MKMSENGDQGDKAKVVGGGEEARIEAVKKRCSGVKGWLTRATNSLSLLLAQEEPASRLEIVDCLEDFDMRLLAYDEAQAELEYITRKEDLDQIIQEAYDYRCGCKKVRLRAVSRLATLDENLRKEDNASVSANSNSKPDVKLPKLILPEFKGEVVEWQSFWDQFNAVVHQSELPDITKFTYLKSVLKDEALSSIKGLSLTSKNYYSAINILQDRFGRKERIVFSHVQELLSMVSSGKQNSLVNLRKLQDKVLNNVRSLEALEITGQQYGVLLTPIVLSCLPNDFRIEWARNSAGHENDLDWLLKFLDDEIQLRETSATFKNLAKQEVTDEKKKKPTTASALPAITASAFSCSLCDKSNHPTYKCYELTRCNLTERKAKIMRKGLCFKCLAKGHTVSDCVSSKTCSSCGGSHHFVICPKSKKEFVKREPETPKSELNQESAIGNSSLTGTVTLAAKQSEVNVIMQTMSVRVQGSKGSVLANILFDSGSDRSYISRGLVDKVGPTFTGSELVSYATFGSGNASKDEFRSVYSVQLHGTSQGSAAISAIEVPIVCVPLHRKRIPQDILKSFNGIEFVENYSQNETKSVDILIGLDYYWKLVKPDSGVLRKGMVALNTVFGWLLSGSFGNGKSPCSTLSHPLLCIQDSDFRRIWDVNVPADDDSVEHLLDNFKSKIKFKEGRYEVSLPWKLPEKGSRIVDNFDQALRRFNGLKRKLANNTDLQAQYDQVLQEMEDSGFIEEVPVDEVVSQHPVYYLPHRPVVRDSSTSTKVRPVFDASAKSGDISLNDLLETGPNLVPNLVEIIIRFRRWPIALIADIKKAFLQIGVRKEDQDVHRFLWEQNGSLRIMRLVRVPFGNRSSPFILNATIKHHLEQYKPDRVVKELNTNLYVDDLLSGADTEAEAKQMVADACRIMSEAGMTLTKWGSNSSEVVQNSYDLSASEPDSLKVLGLKWLPSEDCFAFEGIPVDQNLVITKRVVLSLIARLFDSMGMITPFSISLKSLFQDLWKLGLDWDTEVPEEYRVKVQGWIEDLSHLKSFRVSRPYTSGPWRNVSDVQLHAFGDASERAFGACVYLVARNSEGHWTSSLVLSKARVAPVKKVTLPRLELLGAVLAIQLVEFVRKALDLDKDSCYCWTDSTIVLNWIQGDAYKWKPFVANRISQIQDLTAPSHWSHCSGSNNPADLVTRGISASDLIESELWLSGPSFLIEGVNLDVDKELSLKDEDSHQIGDEYVSQTLVSASENLSQVVDTERWSTLMKSVRVVGWILRFAFNAKSKPQSRRMGDLSFTELESAKIQLIKIVQAQHFQEEIHALQAGSHVKKGSSLYQLSPFIDDKGLLRVQGRLEFARLTNEEKHPIILPKGHFALLVVRFQHRLLKHAGVKLLLNSLRNTYWILGARYLCKRVKRECISCQKLDAPKSNQIMAPLPEDRVVQSSPFSVSGLDHGGPLYCVDQIGKKFYVLLFTCASTRATHLELVDSLSSETTVLAIRRFIARRGMPRMFMSDNAKGFVAARDTLLKLFGPEGPEWKFIAPRAPWWGGMWERMVGTMKSALKKWVGNRCLTQRELETCLHEIEACLNSRPLSFVGSDLEDGAALTPAHFLLGRAISAKPFLSPDDMCDADHLVQLHSARLCQLDKFWSVWSKEYIRNLPPGRGHLDRGSIQEGSIVLVEDESSKRLQWPLGIVRKVFPGRDKLVRTAEIKTSKGVFIRPIQRLHSLELTAPFTEIEEPPKIGLTDKDVIVNPKSQSDPEPTQVESSVQTRNRYGRIVKKPQRLDL